MKKRFQFVIILCALVLCVFYFSKNRGAQINPPTVSQDFSSSKPVYYEAQSLGPIDDCVLYTKLYQRDQKFLTECTSNYVHFFSKIKPSKKVSEKLRIASFNVFHLGDNQAPLKSIPLVAEIMNQWDFVGAQELMPLPEEEAENNNAIAWMMREDPQLAKSPLKDWELVKPGYLRLLDELRKLDSSWSLILQPRPEGEGSTGEMAGFYYRSSMVQIKEWSYCPEKGAVELTTGVKARNLGCSAQVSEQERKLISRTAFTAFFKSGRFDFVGLTIHNRFRPVMDANDMKEQVTEICSQTTLGSACKIPKETVGRFYEVYAVINQLPKIKSAAKDKDIIFMGDFNLEIAPATAEIWKATLKKEEGLTPLQTDGTTLSIRNQRLASNYDHFIVDPKKTSACDYSTVKSFNFVEAAIAPKNALEEKIRSFLLPEVQNSWLTQLRSESEKYIRFQSKRELKTIRLLTEKELLDREESLKEAQVRAQVNPYGAMLEILSDHLPIEMVCSTQLRDDD